MKAHPLRWHRQVVVWLVALCQGIQRELAHLHCQQSLQTEVCHSHGAGRHQHITVQAGCT